MKNCIIASTSTVYGSGYLEYLQPELKLFFQNTTKLIFIPYAQPSGITCDQYTQQVQKAFDFLNIEVIGIHTLSNPQEALLQAEGIFTGGGNTFRLVTSLYQNQLIDALRQAILNGVPYLGTSAGSNICGVSMQTTNDMPIIYPPSFNTLGILPFNINPHYLDPVPGSTHMGETRETRIKEFHSIHNLAVIGLREGSWIRVQGEKYVLQGELTARVFQAHTSPFEVKSGTDLGSIVNEF